MTLQDGDHPDQLLPLTFRERGVNQQVASAPSSRNTGGRRPRGFASSKRGSSGGNRSRLNCQNRRIMSCLKASIVFIWL